MKLTIRSYSATVTEAFDFPMKTEYGNFFSHEEALEYLNNYADNFNVIEHIKINVNIKNTEKVDGIWNIYRGLK
ncbi:MAG: hypothetical protein HRT37_00745 [Alteromonadaceae bacterium]|nr:hypothetical protein [Alteromonadaceae bacterium]